MSDFLLTIISLFSLLTIASYIFIFSKKINFSYTILLFLVGIFIVFFQNYFYIFHFITKLELSTDMVFFIFLPILIFESAFDMPYKKILRDAFPIAGLAIFSLIISAIIIGILFKLALLMLGFNVSYYITILFGIIISATDPISVLSIFKELGVPKRIGYIFESESLFNDGTAMVLFVVFLDIIKHGCNIAMDNIFFGILIFLSMIFFGIILGFVIGFIVSKLIQISHGSWASLTLTMIMAHFTFIVAELISHYTIVKISPIIATTIAALVLGNYGRYKITTKVKKMMDITWGYLAFIVNSLIFLLMGMMIGKIDFHIKEFLLPILVGILIVAFARAISVLFVLVPMNKYLKYKIPKNYQILLSWGSLRGAIAITMLLLIPNDFTIANWSLNITVKEFLMIMAISCIVFTLIIKTTTIKMLIKKLGIAKLSKEDEFTMHQIKDILDKTVLKGLNKMKKNKYVSSKIVLPLTKMYKRDDDKEHKKIDMCHLSKKQFCLLLKKYALGIERNAILLCYDSHQVDEHTLKNVLGKIENQYMRLEMGVNQTRSKKEKEEFFYKLGKKIKKIMNFYDNKKDKKIKRYAYFHSKVLITEEVVKQLSEFKKKFYSHEKYDSDFDEIIEQYEKWAKMANIRKMKIAEDVEGEIYLHGVDILNNHFVFIEKNMIEIFYNKQIIDGKIKKNLKKSIFKSKRF